MGEVKYSINGKYFKDYGIYVSSSLGLLDALKRKPIKTYDWPEYHGESLDLTSPKFEAREIVLNCFIKGNNYQEMFDNFRNVVLSEFQKSGTQRLLVEPFGYKALPFEVYMIDEVKVAKEFSESTSIGVFSIKLIEPNPIKKVLYLTENKLNLSYNSSKETEIFFVNGEKTTAKGNVSLSGKTLANRVVSGYAFEGRNYARNGNYNDTSFLTAISNINTLTAQNNELRVTGGNNGYYYHYGFPAIALDETITISFWVKNNTSNPNNVSPTLNGNGGFGGIYLAGNQGWTKYSKTGRISDATLSNLTYILFENYNGGYFDISIKELKVEKGTKATDWSPAPEDERYIIIAGDIDGITNLTTNAEVLWEKL